MVSSITSTSCNVKMSEKSRNKCHSNHFQWCHLSHPHPAMSKCLKRARSKCHSNHFQWCPLSHPHPAMSKCLKRAKKTSVILIVFNGVLYHIHILQCQNVWKEQETSVILIVSMVSSITSISCNVKMSEKSRNKCHSNRFQWCPLSYPHPAMSKCLKRTETSVILIIFNGVLYHIHILQCQNVWKEQKQVSF